MGTPTTQSLTSKYNKKTRIIEQKTDSEAREGKTEWVHIHSQRTGALKDTEVNLKELPRSKARVI